ncbi:MAG: restriction endonuclease subunit S [Fibrobacter sp.]|nr:restriction endonuclease subunit S [Fibrobacter sp.]
MVPLVEIFDVWYGVNLEVVNSEVVPVGIPFVSRQSVNNGVVCHVKRINNIEPNPSHTLSIAVSGSVLSTFYHDYEYYSGRDIYVAKPKIDLTKEEMLYYCYVIEQNKYKYNYGRGANKTFKNILVPSKDEIPHYVNQKEVNVPFVSKSLLQNKLNFNVNEWKWFVLKDWFDEPYKANAYNSQDLIPCIEKDVAIAHITRTDENNGCKDFVVNESFGSIEEPNAITIGDTTATIFYQEKEFICSDHMVILRSKYLNKYTGLFIVTMLNKERFRYNYGRAYNKGIIANTKIKLPAVKIAPNKYEPDWQFMEDYIKSLPYSSCL